MILEGAIPVGTEKYLATKETEKTKASVIHSIDILFVPFVVVLEDRMLSDFASKPLLY